MKQAPLTDGALATHLKQLREETWGGRLNWRTSGTRWALRYNSYSIEWRMRITGNRLMFTRSATRASSDSNNRGTRRFVSRPLTGEELGPLLEAIVFSQEKSDG